MPEIPSSLPTVEVPPNQQASIVRVERPALGFGPASTPSEVLDGIDLTGKRAIVTGAGSGIGLATARALALAGAQVTLAVRNASTGARAAAAIRQRQTRMGTPTRLGKASRGAVAVAALDLSDAQSIAGFAEHWRGPLHILVNNAGVMAVPDRTCTRSGLEIHLATNHLGHFALASALHGALTSAEGSRIVSVSSSAHLSSPVVFDDLNFAFRPYEKFSAYGQSKTANVLFTVEASRRWLGDGITANALHPGGVATDLQRHVGGSAYMKIAASRFAAAGETLKSVEQGAATSVLLAAHPALDGITGRYFEDCQEARVVQERGTGLRGVAPYALDQSNAARLWQVSLDLIAGQLVQNSR